MKNNEFIKVKKGDFAVCVKIFGKNKVLGEFYQTFETENNCELRKKDLQEIEEYIVNRSNIPEEKIEFTIVRVIDSDNIL